MAQTVPFDALLGASKTGLAIGATLYELDGSTSYAAFSTTDWYEAPAGSGGWHHAGLSLPDAGGVVAVGISGTEYLRIAVDAGAAVAAAIKAKTDNLPAAPASTTNITAGTITTVTNLTNAPTAGDLTDTMKASVTTAATAATPTAAAVTGAVGSVTGDVGGNVVGSVASVTAPVTAGTVSDKTGYSLSAAGIQAIWDALTSALTTVGSIGKRIADNLDATITSRMATFTYTTPPTVAAISDGVWDEATAGHTTADTFGEQLKTDVDAILDDTGTAGVVVAVASKTGYELSATGIAAIWANATRTLTSFGTLAADVWAVAVRTITGGSLTVSPPTVGDIDTQLSNTHGSGAWATATGFATPTNVSDAQTAITNAIAALNNLSTGDLATALATYDGATGTELSATQTAITNAIAALNNLSSAQAQDAATAALTAYDPPTKAELDTAQSAIIAAIPGTTAIVDAIKAYAVETGVTFNDALRIILAANGGGSLADDANDPTEIIYYAPDGTTARLTFALTATTRTVA